jgi:hypothetical protein
MSTLSRWSRVGRDVSLERDSMRFTVLASPLLATTVSHGHGQGQGERRGGREGREEKGGLRGRRYRGQ